MDDVLVFYRCRTGSITSTESVKKVQENFNSWSVFENFIITHTPELFAAEQIQATRIIIFRDLVLYTAKLASLNFINKN